MQTLKSSSDPIAAIERVSYPGQAPYLRQHRSGYEWYMGVLPELRPGDNILQRKIAFTKSVMEDLAEALKVTDWIDGKKMAPNTFERTILAIEEPVQLLEGPKEGAEIIVAQWGAGFASHVHGHAAGYLHEAILKGKVRVNTYRMVDPASNVVRPVKTEIVEAGTFAAIYTPPNPANKFPRQALIHNFLALETTSTLHFLPEHTRDARDNAFQAEYFEDVYHIGPSDVVPISGKEAMYLTKGSVALVRSANVPDYGDHYIVITGHPVMKPHGLRPQDVAIQAPHADVLDLYGETFNGLTILKLDYNTTKRFHEFHGITMHNGEVVFPIA